MLAGPRLEGAPQPVEPHFGIRSPDAMREGQPYWRIGSRPYVRRDGQESAVVTWQSFCPDCSQPFVCTEAEGALPQSRRCPEHRAPGRAVAGGVRR